MTTIATLQTPRTSEFARALAAEWRKLWAVRAVTMTLISLPIIALLFAWLFSNGGGRGFAELSAADAPTFDPTAISLQNHLMAQLVVGVLGVLAISVEYSTGMIATTAIAVPRRGVLFTAKACVVTAAALIVGAATGLLSFWLGQLIIGGYGAPTASLADRHVLRAVLGMSLYLGLVALLGLAVGTIVRSSAGALGIIVTVVLILPALSQNLPASIAEPIARWWPSQAGSRIMTVVVDPDLLAPWPGFSLFLVVVAAVVAAAYVTFRVRDI